MSRIRPRRHKPRKEFDFVPSKESVIYGAFKDLGKPINFQHRINVAKSIAGMWGEEI